MRRASFTAVASGGGIPGEPLIVVEESSGIAEEDEEADSQASSPTNGPAVNQYLLTPYRDLRKRSLPTPPCTSGITASQVRRLSERGGEGSGPSPIEQAFLATLSTAPTPQPGARRHSVVTISRAPPPSTLFGRNRRESIAAFATGAPIFRDPGAVYHSRGSLSGQGSQSGSSFNLQLDIMDDIAEAKARAKDKRKVSWSPAPAIDEVEKDASKKGPKRRASELPSLTFTPSGIVCSNTDLINLLSPLTSSADEVGAGTEKELPNITVNPNTGSPTVQKSILDKKRKLLKDRSNSFDVATMAAAATSGWFAKRHQPIAMKKDEQQKSVVVTFTDEKLKTSIAIDNTPKPPEKSPEVNKVRWDGRSGSIIDAQVIGSAIEVFLNRRSSQGVLSPKNSPTKSQPVTSSISSWLGLSSQPVATSSSSCLASSQPGPSTSSTSWLGTSKTDEAAGNSESCETSLRTALKDLFVK